MRAQSFCLILPNDRVIDRFTSIFLSQTKVALLRWFVVPMAATFVDPIDEELLSADLQVPIVVSSKSCGLCSTHNRSEENAE